MLEMGSSPRLGWESPLTRVNLKPHLCWAGTERFGGVAEMFTRSESTFSQIAGAGDKDDLSVSIDPSGRVNLQVEIP